MNKEIISKYKGRVKLLLKKGRVYTGEIIDLYEDCFTLCDIHNDLITISYDTIAEIRPADNGGQ